MGVPTAQGPSSQGLDVARVVPSEVALAPLLCASCTTLVPLESALVAGATVFCGKQCTVETQRAQLLSKAQPLAFALLGCVQVRCEDCSWTGDYSQLSTHEQTEHKKHSDSTKSMTSESERQTIEIPLSSEIGQTPPQQQQQQGDSSIEESINIPVVAMTDEDESSSNQDDSDSESPKQLLQQSINSMAQWNDSTSMIDDSTTNDDTDDQPLVESASVEHTEKLKKQANAKFNKGDFAAARALYTEGIQSMQGFSLTTTTQRQLLAHMHSNRGVTYFREKLFQECIDDCKRAVECDPSHDKSWIRWWRAVVAGPDWKQAHRILERAKTACPTSQRIAEEHRQSHHHTQILVDCHELIRRKDYGAAHRRLSETDVSQSSHLQLLCTASRLCACTGQATLALEWATRALRLNPQNPQALELQGWSRFLMGDTEQGSHLLYDACRMLNDDESSGAKSLLTQCQKMHTALSTAQSLIKKGQCEQAIASFHVAVKESANIPPAAPLYSSIRVGRADARFRQGKYMEALRDVEEVLAQNKEHSSAWIIRAEVLSASGKVGQAFDELTEIRETWGLDDRVIEDGYRRLDFEKRVLKEQSDLQKLVSDLEAGNCRRIAKLGAHGPSVSAPSSASARRGTTGIASSSELRKRRSTFSMRNASSRAESSSRRQSKDGVSIRSNRRRRPCTGDEDASVGVRSRVSTATSVARRYKDTSDAMSVGLSRRTREVSVNAERKTRSKAKDDITTKIDRHTRRVNEADRRTKLTKSESVNLTASKPGVASRITNSLRTPQPQRRKLFKAPSERSRGSRPNMEKAQSDTNFRSASSRRLI